MTDWIAQALSRYVTQPPLRPIDPLPNATQQRQDETVRRLQEAIHAPRS